MLPFPGMNFTAFDILTAAEMNQLVDNIEALADGTAIAAGSIGATKLSTSAIKLGTVSRTSDFTTSSGTPVQVTGMTLSPTIPSGGREVQIEVFAANGYQASSGGAFEMSLWDGAVGSGTQLSKCRFSNTANANSIGWIKFAHTPSAGGKTYNVGLKSGAGLATLEAGALYPAQMNIKLV